MKLKGCALCFIEASNVTGCILRTACCSLLCRLAEQAARFEQNWIELFVHSVGLLAVRVWR